MPRERYFIDSNIPMYVDGSEHPLKAPCVQTLMRLANEAIPCLTSVEVIQEIVHGYVHLGRRCQAQHVVDDFLTIVPDVLPVSVADMRLMLSYVERFPGLSARDMIHVAVMVNNNVSTIISTDEDFDRVPGIARIDPRRFV